MASSESEGGSLFEGMVLFSPSDLSVEPPPPPAPPTASQHESQPLDEDLFSDLTLVQPQPPQPPQPPQSLRSHDPSPPLQPSPPPPSSEPSPLTRQISRKKKRAVRIGYARSDAIPLPPDSPSSSSSNSSAPLPMQETTPPPPPPPPPPPAAETAESHLELPDQFSRASDDASTQQPRIAEEEEEAEGRRRGPAAEAAKETSDREDGSGSIEEKMELVRARISSKLDSVRRTAAAVSAERKEAERRRRKAAEDLDSATCRHRELEKELEEACEAEEFERAEKVSESLAAAEGEKDELLIVLRGTELECDSVDARMQLVLESLIAAEEEGLALLEQFAKDAAEYADLVLKNAEEVSSKKLEEWQSSMELLEAKKLEMSIESHLINEGCIGFEHAIESLVEDDRKEQERLRREGDILAKELDELLALVRAKEAEIAKNNSLIQEVEKRISNVVSEFHETQSSIDTKRENLQAALSEIESESAALSVRKEEIDESISLAQQKRSKLMELASVSADEAKTCQELVGLRKSLVSSILKSREDRVRLAKTEEKILEDIQILRQQISYARTSLQELSSTRATIQQEIASIKQRTDFIDKRGPELEAEKKVAAAARNFKEAGRIASEAKALNIEKEDLLNKKEKAALDLEKLETEIKDILDKIQESERLISIKEKEAAMAGCKRLKLVAAAARAERSAALEMGDSEEGEILLKEAESAESRARELQEAYDLELVDNEKALEHLVSVSFIINLARQHLAEMASSFNPPATSSLEL